MRIRSVAWMVAVALFVGLLGVRNAEADSLSVYVGYADSLRPNGSLLTLCSGFSPTCQVQQGAQLDGGVFQIENTGSDPVTITDVTITLNSGIHPVTFALWNNVTLAPGQAAILGQTAQWNFDSSDYPFLASGTGIGINGIGGCSTLSTLSSAQQALCAANFPVISFDENGHPVTLIDSGSILDTGGHDLAAFGANESIGWHLAGQVTPTPEPSSIVLIGLGLIALLGLRRRNSRKRTNELALP